MTKYGYLVVEGPHDVEFVRGLLRPFGFHRVRLLKDLDPFWRPLVPTAFPHKDDLLKRVPVPLFLRSETHSIALHSAIGDSQLVDTIEESMALPKIGNAGAIGLILDSDKKVSAADRFANIRSLLQEKKFTLPGMPGEVSPGPPRLGAFVLPDNQSPGTLEDLLLECAKRVYPNLLVNARQHVDAAGSDMMLDDEDLKDFKKPAGKNKAIVGSIASILKPGKAIQVSIQDNRWLRDDALKLPKVKAVQTFLADLFELGQRET